MRRRALHVTVVFALLTGLFALLGSAASAAPSNQTVTTSGFCGINFLYAQGARVVARNATPSGTEVGSNATIQVDLYTIFGRFFNSGGAPFGPLPYVGFVVTGPNASGATSTAWTVQADTNGHATLSYTNSLAGTDTVLVWWDMNNNGVRDCLEPVTVVQVTFGAGLSLSPATQVNVADGADTGTLTATLEGFTDTNLPPATAQVLASATGVLNFTNQPMGAITCDATGCTAILTLGPTTSTGMDSYTAFLDLNGNGTQDADEPSATSVTGTWATLTLSPAGQTVSTTTTTVTATINGFNSTYPPTGAIVRGTATGGSHADAVTFSAITCGPTNCTATATVSVTTSISDSITAYLDVNDNNVQDTNEPAAPAVTVFWS